jgi:putative transposase
MVMRYRRPQWKGGTFFFTVVTHERRSFLCEHKNIELLRESFREVKTRHPFAIDAIVILPDHIHAIWTLPEDDGDFSRRWRLIKSHFTRSCDEDCKGVLMPSRIKRKQQAVWQHRFWEHRIRDDEDFARHADYIHYNPVKHGYVTAPIHWPYSSFHRFVREGGYQADWGNSAMEFDPPIGHE